MKCTKRSAEAVSVCAYCGRALCNGCIQSPTAPRMVCSEGCAAALTRASAFYCYVSGGLSATAAVVAWFMLPSPFLILFTGAYAVVLIASGIWYGRGAKRQNTEAQ